MKQHWRNAATLIVLAKQFRGASASLKRHPNASNYDILLETRPQSASTFPNSVVFPGGVTEKVDASDRWLSHIGSFGYSQEHFEGLHCLSSGNSPIFKENPIRRHISLRITAIRETFEELGILIGSRSRCEDRKTPWANIILDFNVKEWQLKVSEDPGQLFTLCEELNCYPDIWALHYWSNWLTPTTYQKRFDTLFFVTALEEKPTHIESANEVAKVEWSSIDDIIERYKNKEINILPPQLYELYRISSFENAEDFVEFASKRSKYGSELYFPFVINAKDGVLHVLPGDDLYPENIDLYNSEAVTYKDKTVTDLREGCNIIHRAELLHNNHREFIVKNFKPLNHINMNSRVTKIHT